MTSDRLRVYVSGPLSGSGDRLENVRRACNAGLELIKAGFAPLIPHLTHYMDNTDALGHDTWMEVDLPWVAMCDVLLRLPGKSKGADMEVGRAKQHGIPVYENIESMVKCPYVQALSEDRAVDTGPGGDQAYMKILQDMADLHVRKAHGYGTDADPLANLRASSELGIEPWRAALIRFGDKWGRIKSFVQTGRMSDESFEDNAMDGAAYLLLALRLYREAQSPSVRTTPPAVDLPAGSPLGREYASPPAPSLKLVTDD